MKITARLLEEKPEEHSLMGLSVSKVKTFKDCKAKFHFCYVQKLPRKEYDFRRLYAILNKIY